MKTQTNLVYTAKLFGNLISISLLILFIYILSKMKIEWDAWSVVEVFAFYFFYITAFRTTRCIEMLAHTVDEWDAFIERHRVTPAG